VGCKATYRHEHAQVCTVRRTERDIFGSKLVTKPNLRFGDEQQCYKVIHTAQTQFFFLRIPLHICYRKKCFK
jgi:hypothetical protein